MNFVTTKRDGYALFATTPSGRAAIGLTEDQRRLHLLARAGEGWETLRDWSVDDVSHTDVLLKLGDVDEPPDPQALLSFLPSPRDLH